MGFDPEITNFHEISSNVHHNPSDFDILDKYFLEIVPGGVLGGSGGAEPPWESASLAPCALRLAL